MGPWQTYKIKQKSKKGINNWANQIHKSNLQISMLKTTSIHKSQIKKWIFFENENLNTWILEFFYKIMAIVMGYEFVTCGVSNLDFGAFVAPSLGL